MARSSLAGKLQEAAAVAREAASRGAPVDEVIEERAGMRRREVLAGGAALAAGAILGRRLPRALAASAPRIAIVGGGLAGLTCAYRLKQAGYAATLYEGSDRLGGRCWTRRGEFAERQIAEHGGELIDQGHTQTRQLVQELGLDLDNLLAAEAHGADPFYYFDGQRYMFAEATEDLKAVWQQLHKDLSAASYPTLCTQSTRRGRELDAISIAEWIDTYVPGGLGSKLGQLLDVAYNIEYGAETDVQSSLNLIYLLGYSGPGQLRIFGPSNEKYHVRGGNDQIVSRLAAALPGQIGTGSQLLGIKHNADGSYRLSLSSGPVSADRVVLALPFSILRELDFAKAGFSKVKETAIRQLGMGTNSKLHVQFTSRHWTSLGNQGETYADTGCQNTWEVTRAQPGSAGILVDYTGGTIGASFGSGTPSQRAERFLAQLEPVLPGISARWNGRATIDFWTGDPWTKGSYSYWKVGQYTKFAGAERQQEGACHFAGEHTSIDAQGYLEGAVESGGRAATEIVAALR